MTPSVLLAATLQVQSLITHWCETVRPTLILTIGGCGLGRSGTVPHALRSILVKDAPFLATHLLKATADRCGAELLVAEEAVVGVVGQGSAIATLPSSPTTAVSSGSTVVSVALDVLVEFLPRLVRLAQHGAA